jgi:hypothetical protein
VLLISHPPSERAQRLATGRPGSLPLIVRIEQSGQPSRRPDGCENGSSGRSRRDECVHGEAITRLGGGARVLAVGCDHPAIRGAMIAFVTERSSAAARLALVAVVNPGRG